jgi:hypothetical protein
MIPHHKKSKERTNKNKITTTHLVAGLGVGRGKIRIAQRELCQCRGERTRQEKVALQQPLPQCGLGRLACRRRGLWKK